MDSFVYYSKPEFVPVVLIQLLEIWSFFFQKSSVSKEYMMRSADKLTCLEYQWQWRETTSLETTTSRHQACGQYTLQNKIISFQQHKKKGQLSVHITSPEYRFNSCHATTIRDNKAELYPPEECTGRNAIIDSIMCWKHSYVSVHLGFTSQNFTNFVTEKWTRSILLQQNFWCWQTQHTADKKDSTFD